MTVRQALATLAVLLTAVLVSTGTVVSAEARTPAERYSKAAFTATNSERAERDRARLRQHACLQRFATDWAEHMARTEKLVHQSLRPIARACRLSYTGENIAYGYSTGRAVVRGWMNSPGHRENILRPQFRLMAIGAARDDDGRWWSSQVFGRR